MHNLFVGYNSLADIRVLIYAFEKKQAQYLVDKYCKDYKLKNSFEIMEVEKVNSIDITYDYVLTSDHLNENDIKYLTNFLIRAGLDKLKYLLELNIDEVESFFMTKKELLMYIKYTYLHRKMIEKLSQGTKYVDVFKNHDLDKYALYLILPKKEVSKYHRKINKHHMFYDNSLDECYLYEMALDWESAHFTKPDKPLSAYETLLKYYSDMEERMKPILKNLGLWEICNYKPLSKESFHRMCDRVEIADIMIEFKKCYDFYKNH